MSMFFSLVYQFVYSRIKAFRVVHTGGDEQLPLGFRKLQVGLVCGEDHLDLGGRGVHSDRIGFSATVSTL